MQGQEQPVRATDLIDGFITQDKEIVDEKVTRIENSKGMLSFGVSFLDEALGGIYKNDLIVLGARSGAGKTQLSTLIAMSNAIAGKRVHYLALEAEKYEIGRRMKYQVIADEFYSDMYRPNIRLNYADWYYGKFIGVLDKYEQIAVKRLNYKTMNTFYRTGDFTEKEFERIYLSIKDETDLVIIDHLHYFDFTDDNENRAVKTIVKKIRDLTLNIGKPVILVSHIRKTDKRLKQVVPDLEDFHGSSDIGKIATKAIVIAPDMSAPMTDGTRSTYMAVMKFRVDGARTRSMALINYNVNKQRYDKKYLIGRLNVDQTEFVRCVKDEIPYWSTSYLNQ